MVQDGFQLGWMPLSRFSHEAVIVFFVLSGYVIAHSTIARRRTWLHYATARLTRVLSVAMPAVLFSFGLAWVLGQSGSIADAASSVLFLNESWTNSATLPVNGPYWSLCYEVWYYLLFGMAFFLPWRHRWLCLPVAAIAGPAIMLLLPIWLLGVWLASRPALNFGSEPRALCAATAGLVVIIAVGHAGFGIDVSLQTMLKDNIPGFWRLVYSQRFLTDYILALAVAIHLIGVRSVIDRWGSSLAGVERPIRFLAGCSFSIYLFHRPMSTAIGQLQPDASGSIAMSILSLALILTGCLLLARLTEHRVSAWRSLLMSVRFKPAARLA